MVNVTFQSQTFPMIWNITTETYWIQLDGTEFIGVPDFFNLTVNAVEKMIMKRTKDS